MNAKHEGLMHTAGYLGMVGLLIVPGSLPGSALGANSFLTPLGPVADAEREYLLDIIGITMIAIMPVLIGVPLILWRYRRGNKRATYRPHWTFSKPLDIAMWGVPVLIISFLSVWLWHHTVKYDPYKPLGVDPLHIQVVGLDWKWLFIYPEQGVASVGEMALPVDRPVSLSLTTNTVMQSFMVPALAGQIYAMAGMQTQLNFIADRPGTTRGQNTQYTGAGFSEQFFTVHALPEGDWQGWVAKARTAPLALNKRTYARLAKRGSRAEARQALAPGQDSGPLLFASVPPDLFQQIINRYHDGKGLTAQQQPGSPAYRAGGENE
ncbi:ubiquinol oxidase subunit II [Halomonas garicola]|uniref:ubiquinol oxidase subunit II n=1 Tax=Halomonas garicola TaxID=1690008 RepID=UPI0028985F1A|nr:ubiquinol oxidase subunit II [Halomonas garicola]